MFQYNNFYQLRDRLSNSACLINSNFGFSTKDSLLPTPNKTNGSLINVCNKAYALCSANNLIIQNVDKQYIPTKKITIDKKFSNSELNIGTRNNENNLIGRAQNEFGVEIIAGTRKCFIYKDDEFVKSLIVSSTGLEIFNIYHYFYIVTKNSIMWINTLDEANITSGLIADPIGNNEEIISSKGFIYNDKLHIILVSNNKLAIVKTPIVETVIGSDGTAQMTLNHTIINVNNCIPLPNYYSNKSILDVNYHIIEDSVISTITNLAITGDNYYITVTADKFTAFYLFNGTTLQFSNYVDGKSIYNTYYNGTVVFVIAGFTKLFKTYLKYENKTSIANNDEDLPVVSIDFGLTLFFEDSNVDQVALPFDCIPDYFDVCFSKPKIYGPLLALDGGIFGVLFISDIDDPVVQGYIKPFPYYNSNLHVVKNTLYTKDNKNFLLSSYMGLFEFSFSDETNEVFTINEFVDDGSLFIIPSSIFIKVQKYNALTLDEEIFFATEIWYDCVFSVFILPLHNDLFRFVQPVPLTGYIYQEYSLNNVAFVYSSGHSYSPLLTRVNALGENTLTSNYCIKNNEIVYNSLFDIGTVVSTDINATGSLLFNPFNTPLGLIVKKTHQILVNNDILNLLIENHLEQNLYADICIPYNKIMDEGVNRVIDIIFNDDNSILDLLYFSYENRKVSIIDKTILPFIVDIDGMILEIYTSENKFLGYVYVKITHNSEVENNIPFEYQNSNFYYMSSLFATFKAMETDNQINNESFFNYLKDNKVKIRPTGFQFENNKVFAVGIKITKFESAPLGLNVISINDITEGAFSTIAEYSNFQNNLTYYDIEVARSLGIEGFLVTGVSEIFNDTNGHIDLLGNIIDKLILNNYYKHYMGDNLIKYFKLNKSSTSVNWDPMGTIIHKNPYNITLESYSI